MNLLDLDEVKPAGLRDIAQMLMAEIPWDRLLQFLLAVLGLAAILMVATTGPWHRWGFVVGLLSQPFWILAAWRGRTPAGERQWGMLAVSICYVFVWILGIGERFPSLFG